MVTIVISNLNKLCLHKISNIRISRSDHVRKNLMSFLNASVSQPSANRKKNYVFVRHNVRCHRKCSTIMKVTEAETVNSCYIKDRVVNLPCEIGCALVDVFLQFNRIYLISIVSHHSHHSLKVYTVSSFSGYPPCTDSVNGYRGFIHSDLYSHDIDGTIFDPLFRNLIHDHACDKINDSLIDMRSENNLVAVCKNIRNVILFDSSI